LREKNGPSSGNIIPAQKVVSSLAAQKNVLRGSSKSFVIAASCANWWLLPFSVEKPNLTSLNIYEMH
jgi:hypothetical protein